MGHIPHGATAPNRPTAHILRLFAPLALLIVCLPATASDRIPRNCPASGKIEFVCGLPKAEDLIAIDGSNWVLASSLSEKGEGLYLVNRRTRQVRPALDPSSDRRPAPDLACRPSLGRLRTHGLAIQNLGGTRLRLLAINHYAAETIEIFDIDRAATVPRLRWAGCIKLPAPMIGNSVVGKRDGTIYFSDTAARKDVSDQAASVLRGDPSGQIVEWCAGHFRTVEAGELHGPSGTILSADERWLFATSFADRKIWRVDLTGRTPPRSIMVRFHPDNLHSYGRDVIAAGQATDLKAFMGCYRRPGRPAYCSHQWGIAVIEPVSLKMREHLVTAPDFGDVTAAAPVDGKIWLGSIGEPDRIAITTVP